MTTEQSNIEALEARHFCYMALQSVFGVDPAKAQIAALASEETKAWFCKFSSDPQFVASADSFFEAAAQADAGDLKSVYTRLFLGPGPMIAGPWESIYVNQEPLLFVESTIDVRKAYLSQGFAPKLFPNVADDHIALELDFMKRLAEAMLVFAAEGDDDAFAGAKNASVSFLREHLLKWDKPFAAKIREAKSPYFSAAAGLLVSFLSADAAFLS